MPLSQTRLALAGFLLSLMAALAAVGNVAAAPTPQDNPIVARAFQDLGTYQGQCWTWMQQVVLEATGRKVGFDYRQGFFEAGAVEVTLAEAGPGDVVQIANDAWTTPDADYPGMHTAIIIERVDATGFRIIESNGNWDGMVGIRGSVYRPAELAAARGLQYHIYRLTGSAPPPAPPASTGPLQAGEPARVNTPKEVLHLHAVPGVSSDVLAELPDGTSVTLLEAPRLVGNYSWVKVRTSVGDGFVATDYLVRASASAPASGAGEARPILLYRSFAPAIAASSD